MKANAIYIFILVCAIAVILLVVSGSKKERHFDDTITLRRQDKIPYGTYVAFDMLRDLFPNASITPSREQPGYWDSLNMNVGHQAFISISKYFNADEYEMKKLIEFAKNGNDVFICTNALSYDAQEILYSSSGKERTNQHFPNAGRSVNDSLELKLVIPAEKVFHYPGRNFSSSFSELNMATSDIIGRSIDGAPDFIHLRTGKGNFYVHLAPLAFSNYFILHKNNIQYYETAMSVIPRETRKLVWDEYYLYKRSDQSSRAKKGWFSVLLKYPGMRAGLLTAILLLLVYVAMEMRRKQRYIPVVTKPRNDSLDFVRTIGRLYYEKGDHRNLGRKMSTYFLEYVRTNYKLQTGNLDEIFFRSLQQKSGYPEQELRTLLTTLRYIEDSPRISSKELANFNLQLKSFYKTA